MMTLHLVSRLAQFLADGGVLSAASLRMIHRCPQLKDVLFDVLAAYKRAADAIPLNNVPTWAAVVTKLHEVDTSGKLYQSARALPACSRHPCTPHLTSARMSYTG